MYIFNISSCVARLSALYHVPWLRYMSLNIETFLFIIMKTVIRVIINYEKIFITWDNFSTIASNIKIRTFGVTRIMQFLEHIYGPMLGSMYSDIYE